MEYKYRVDVWRDQRVDSKFETNDISDFCRYLIDSFEDKERSNQSAIDITVDDHMLSYYEKLNYIKAAQILFGDAEYAYSENMWSK